MADKQVNRMADQSEKPRLSFWQIWNVSFGFLGVQFGFALQYANASRILSNLGADLHSLSLFWLVAPIMGLLVQPLVLQCITARKSRSLPTVWSPKLRRPPQLKFRQ